MSRLQKQLIENIKTKVADKKLSLEERKLAHKQIMEGMLNPKAKKDFDPETFDPMEGVDDYEVKKRGRKEPPRTLPTMGMKPKEILEGQMVGMFESKQDLYLLIAWLSERVTKLEDIVENKKKNPQV